MTPLAAYENLRIFARRWGKKYPSRARLDRERNVAYFTYLRFPENVRRMIYSTNWVERLNRCYKRTLLMRGAMPSPASVVYLLGSVAKEKTEGMYARRLPFFGNGKSSKTTNKNQHHKFPSGLGYPKSEGKDEGESYTLFRTLPLD